MPSTVLGRAAGRGFSLRCWFPLRRAFSFRPADGGGYSWRPIVCVCVCVSLAVVVGLFEGFAVV